MRWKPVVVQSERADGSLVVTVGHPLVDAYLEFLNDRAKPIVGQPATEQPRSDGC
jgi:hypothetical protein